MAVKPSSLAVSIEVVASTTIERRRADSEEVLNSGLAPPTDRRDNSLPGRGGRVAEGGGLLNRYRALKLYRGFESPLLRAKECPIINVQSSMSNHQCPMIIDH